MSNGFQSPREQSQFQSSLLFYRIDELKGMAIRSGVKPTENWLGPSASRVLEVEINHQCNEGRMISDSVTQTAMIQGSMEGCQLMGMTVRLMIQDGVRVGSSWPLP